MVLCTVFAAALLIRAARIQLISDSRLEEMAHKQFHSKVLIRPRRGALLDRNKEPLAINTEINSLAIDPTKIQNKKILIRLLAKALHLPYEKLFLKLHEKREFAWIKRHLSEAEIEQLRSWQIINTKGDLMNGLWWVKENKRIYPHRELAAHVLGSVNIDSEGLEGVELWMNDLLRGKVISVTAIKDAYGRPAFIDGGTIKSLQGGREGEDITLTLDASLQFAVEEELKNFVRKTKSKGGAVVIMNAVNGEVLAMANEPTFNPNEKGGWPESRRNRILTDGYEPGSTLKAVLLASALAQGWKLSSKIWGERGSFQVQGKKISEADPHEKFEWLTLKEMLKVSSNVGSAKLALKISSSTYYQTLRAFGFGDKSYLGFPGEILGKLAPQKSWQPLTLANLGFGHGLLVTPIQMVRAYAVFLNGGWLIQPTLIKNPSSAVPTHPPRRILSTKISQEILAALEAVTEKGGTGVNARVEGYRVAGKTGTSQKVDLLTKTYSNSRYISSFIGFPLNTHPKLVIYTSLDEPSGNYYASETAARLFYDVLLTVIHRFSLPPTFLAQKPPVKDFILSSQAQAFPEIGISQEAKMHGYGVTFRGKFAWKMPSLLGLTPREAIQFLKGHQFQLKIQGQGLIQDQFPEEGKLIAEGDIIRLVLAYDEHSF